jgi:hypothetical protein
MYMLAGLFYQKFRQTASRTIEATGLLQDREEAGLQGGCRPLPEREVSSLPPTSLPPQAAKKHFATALIETTRQLELFPYQ